MQLRRLINTLKSVAYTLFALGTLLVVSSCSVQTPTRAGDKPDPEKITVFYPLGDKVRGRGVQVRFDQELEFVYIATFPSSGKQITKANEDGSFEFSVYAGSRDVIELAYSDDKKANREAHQFTLMHPLHACSRMTSFVAEPGSAASAIGKCIPYGTVEPDCSGANHSITALRRRTAPNTLDET